MSASTDLRAYTQHQELEGTAAADLTQPPSTDGLRGFAESVGINLQQYFPIGVSIYIGEPAYMVSTADRAQVSILAVETAVVGSTGQEIDDYINQNGALPFTRFRTQANLDEALRYLKRVQINLVQRGRGQGSYQETESINL